MTHFLSKILLGFEPTTFWFAARCATAEQNRSLLNEGRNTFPFKQINVRNGKDDFVRFLSGFFFLGQRTGQPLLSRKIWIGHRMSGVRSNVRKMLELSWQKSVQSKADFSRTGQRVSKREALGQSVGGLTREIMILNSDRPNPPLTEYWIFCRIRP